MITTGKLTDRQKKILIALVAGSVILAALFVFIKKKNGNNYNNIIRLAKTYADKGEYDRALSLLDTILLKNSDDQDVMQMLDEIVALKKEYEANNRPERTETVVPVPVNSNVTVDFDADNLTSAMQDSLSSMKSALEESNKQAEENRKAAEDNRRAMENLIKMQEEQKIEDEKRRVREAELNEKKQKEAEAQKVKEAAAAEKKKIAEEKKKAKDAETAKKNAELKKKMDAVNDEIALGRTALATGNIEEAMKHFKKAESMLPSVDGDGSFASSKNSEIAQYLLEASEKTTSKADKQRLINEAVEMAKKTLEENPNDPASHYVMAQDAMTKKDWKLALNELNKAVQNDPDNYLYYYDMGKVQFTMKKYQEASSAFTTSCEKNKNFAPSRYNLGITQLKLNNETGALASFRKAISINPQYEKAYLEEARLLTKRNDYNEALTAYQNVLKINSMNTDAIAEAGSVYYLTGKYSLAETNFRKVISMLSPSEQQTLTKYNLSTVLYDEGNIYEAERWAGEAYKGIEYLSTDKAKSNVVYNYALLLDKSKKVEEAIPLYLEVLKYNPDHIKTKINLGVMYMNLTPPDVDMSLALFAQVYKLDKHNFEAVNNIGSAFLLKEDYANAIKYFLSALKLDSKNIDVRSNLARAYAKNGDYSSAKDAYTELLKLDEKSWDSYVELAKVCLQLNQNDLAQGYLMTLQEKNPKHRVSEVKTLLEQISQ